MLGIKKNITNNEQLENLILFADENKRLELLKKPSILEIFKKTDFTKILDKIIKNNLLSVDFYKKHSWVLEWISPNTGLAPVHLIMQDPKNYGLITSLVSENLLTKTLYPQLLEKAAEAGAFDVFIFLVKTIYERYNVDQENANFINQCINKIHNGSNLFHKFLKDKKAVSEEKIKWFYENGADFYGAMQDSEVEKIRNSTPLCLAIKTNKIENIQTILDLTKNKINIDTGGANDKREAEDDSTLICAIRNEADNEIIDLLLQHGVKIWRSVKYTTFISVEGYSDTVTSEIFPCQIISENNKTQPLYERASAIFHILQSWHSICQFKAALKENISIMSQCDDFISTAYEFVKKIIGDFTWTEESKVAEVKELLKGKEFAELFCKLPYEKLMQLAKNAKSNYQEFGSSCIQNVEKLLTEFHEKVISPSDFDEIINNVKILRGDFAETESGKRNKYQTEITHLFNTINQEFELNNWKLKQRSRTANEFSTIFNLLTHAPSVIETARNEISKLIEKILKNQLGIYDKMKTDFDNAKNSLKNIPENIFCLKVIQALKDINEFSEKFNSTENEKIQILPTVLELKTNNDQLKIVTDNLANAIKALNSQREKEALESVNKSIKEINSLLKNGGEIESEVISNLDSFRKKNESSLISLSSSAKELKLVGKLKHFETEQITQLYMIENNLTSKINQIKQSQEKIKNKLIEQAEKFLKSHIEYKLYEKELRILNEKFNRKHIGLENKDFYSEVTYKINLMFSGDQDSIVVKSDIVLTDNTFTKLEQAVEKFENAYKDLKQIIDKDKKEIAQQQSEEFQKLNDGLLEKDKFEEKIIADKTDIDQLNKNELILQTMQRLIIKAQYHNDKNEIQKSLEKRYGDFKGSFNKLTDDKNLDFKNKGKDENLEKARMLLKKWKFNLDTDKSNVLSGKCLHTSAQEEAKTDLDTVEKLLKDSAIAAIKVVIKKANTVINEINQQTSEIEEVQEIKRQMGDKIEDWRSQLCENIVIASKANNLRAIGMNERACLNVYKNVDLLWQKKQELDKFVDELKQQKNTLVKKIKEHKEKLIQKANENRNRAKQLKDQYNNQFLPLKTEFGSVSSKISTNIDGDFFINREGPYYDYQITENIFNDALIVISDTRNEIYVKQQSEFLKLTKQVQEKRLTLEKDSEELIKPLDIAALQKNKKILEDFKELIKQALQKQQEAPKIKITENLETVKNQILQQEKIDEENLRKAQQEQKNKELRKKQEEEQKKQEEQQKKQLESENKKKLIEYAKQKLISINNTLKKLRDLPEISDPLSDESVDKSGLREIRLFFGVTEIDWEEITVPDHVFDNKEINQKTIDEYIDKAGKILEQAVNKHHDDNFMVDNKPTIQQTKTDLSSVTIISSVENNNPVVPKLEQKAKQESITQQTLVQPEESNKKRLTTDIPVEESNKPIITEGFLQNNSNNSQSEKIEVNTSYDPSLIEDIFADSPVTPKKSVEKPKTKNPINKSGKNTTVTDDIFSDNFSLDSSTTEIQEKKIQNKASKIIDIIAETKIPEQQTETIDSKNLLFSDIVKTSVKTEIENLERAGNLHSQNPVNSFEIAKEIFLDEPIVTQVEEKAKEPVNVHKPMIQQNNQNLNSSVINTNQNFALNLEKPKPSIKSETEKENFLVDTFQKNNLGINSQTPIDDELFSPKFIKTTPLGINFFKPTPLSHSKDVNSSIIQTGTEQEETLIISENAPKINSFVSDTENFTNEQPPKSEQVVTIPKKVETEINQNRDKKLDNEVAQLEKETNQEIIEQVTPPRSQSLGESTTVLPNPRPSGFPTGLASRRRRFARNDEAKPQLEETQINQIKDKDENKKAATLPVSNDVKAVNPQPRIPKTELTKTVKSINPSAGAPKKSINPIEQSNNSQNNKQAEEETEINARFSSLKRADKAAILKTTIICTDKEKGQKQIKIADHFILQKNEIAFKPAAERNLSEVKSAFYLAMAHLQKEKVIKNNLPVFERIKNWFLSLVKTNANEVVLNYSSQRSEVRSIEKKLQSSTGEEKASNVNFNSQLGIRQDKKILLMSNKPSKVKSDEIILTKKGSDIIAYYRSDKTITSKKLKLNESEKQSLKFSKENEIPIELNKKDNFKLFQKITSQTIISSRRTHEKSGQIGTSDMSSYGAAMKGTYEDLLTDKGTERAQAPSKKDVSSPVKDKIKTSSNAIDNLENLIKENVNPTLLEIKNQASLCETIINFKEKKFEINKMLKTLHGKNYMGDGLERSLDFKITPIVSLDCLTKEELEGSIMLIKKIQQLAFSLSNEIVEYVNQKSETKSFFTFGS